MNHRPNCGPRRIVYPVKHDYVNCCTESEVEHVHPSHTTVMNHHLVKNKHVYPHSTSTENTWNEVNEQGPSYNVPGNPTNVGGAMSPQQPGQMEQGPGPRPRPMPNQWGTGNNQVGGEMSHGPMPPKPCNHGKGMGPWQQPNKWC